MGHGRSRLSMVFFGFVAIVGIAHALKVGRFETVLTLAIFGFGFVFWGARAISRGTSIAIRFAIRPSAPSDLAERIDPHTGEFVSYGNLAYRVEHLRYFFLRKELPHKQDGDLIDEVLALLGYTKQPMHPDKRRLIVDVLRGSIASFALLAAFVAAFGIIQFDPVMQSQTAILNLVFLAAFLFTLRYWGLTPAAQTARSDISLQNLLYQIAIITLIAVILP